MMRTEQKKESESTKKCIKDIVENSIIKESSQINLINIKDIVKNSIIKEYPKYIEFREQNEFTRENIKIHEYLSALVTTNSLNACNEGIVIDIVCPAGRIISIIGKDSLPIGYKESPHPFELKLASSDGIELDPDTDIRIFKYTVFKKRTEICNMKYRDVSMLNYSDTPNLFKMYSDLYRFDQGIELKGEDHLRISVIGPNIDINIRKFNLGADLWTQCYD